MSRLILILLALTPLLGYLEWGNHQHAFLFEVEWVAIQKIFSEPQHMLHPMVILPLLGQIMLLTVAFAKNPRPIFVFIGIGFLSVLLIFILFIGIKSFNPKIIGSLLPFFGTVMYYLVCHFLQKPSPKP